MSVLSHYPNTVVKLSRFHNVDNTTNAHSVKNVHS